MGKIPSWILSGSAVRTIGAAEDDGLVLERTVALYHRDNGQRDDYLLIISMNGCVKDIQIPTVPR